MEKNGADLEFKMKNGRLALADIIDHQAVQAMMEDFYRLTHIGCAIIDVSGRVLVAVGWQDICTKFHRVHPETEKNCLESDLVLSKGVPLGEFKTYRCRNNLQDMATPIEVDGRHLGNFYLGQFFYKDEVPDRELFRRQARQYGFDETAYLAAFERVPRSSRETTHTVMAFYSKLANMISSARYANLRLTRALSQKNNALHQLMEKEAHQALVLQTAMDGFWMADMQGRLLNVNETYCRMSGYSLPELLSLNVADLDVNEAEEDTIRHIQEVMTQGNDRFESRHRRKDGSLFDVEVSVQYQPFGGGRMVTFLRDITERKRAEEELRNGEQRLRNIVDGSPIPAFVIGNDHRVIHWNKALEEISGIRFEDVFGTNEHWKAFYNEERPCLADLLVDGSDLVPQWYFGKYAKVQSIADAYEVTDFFTNLGTDGRWLRFTAAPIRDSKGMIAAAIETLEDITERKRAEEVLRESEERYRIITENMRDMLWLMDMNLITTYVSPSAVSSMGFTFEEIQAMPLEKRFSPASTQIINRIIAEELTPERLGQKDLHIERTVELEVLRKDGSFFWSEATLTLIRNREGKPLGIVGVGRDITDRKASETLSMIQRDLAIALSNKTWLNDSLDLCLEAAIRVSGLDSGGVYLVDALTGALEMVCHRGLSSEFVQKKLRLAGDSPNARLIQRGRPVYDSYMKLDLLKEHIDQSEGLKAIAVIPVLYEGRVIACLNVASHKLSDVPPAARLALETISSRMGAVIVRTKIATELRESEERFRVMAEVSVVPMALINPQGTYLFINRRFVEVFGYDQSDIPTGREWFRKAFPNQADRHEAITAWIHDRAVLEAGKVRERSYRVRAKNGSEKDIVFRPVTLANGCELVLYEDVTENKRAEAALRESERKYRELVENANSIILRMDTEGKVFFFNEFAQRFFGFSAEEILGRSVVGTIVPETDSSGRDLAKMIRDIGRNPERYQNNENENMLKNGERVWVTWTNRAMVDSDGRLTEILCIGNDITERKRNEAERAALEFHLQKAQKMEAIGTLAGGIAHDFNNLLFPIIGRCEMLLEDLPGDSDLKRQIQTIMDSGVRASGLVKQILSFSRESESGRSPVKIQKIIQEDMTLIRHSIPTTIDVTLAVDQTCEAVMADAGQIHQVLMNLISNAYHAMENNGGKLVIGLRQWQKTTTDLPLPSGSYVELYVSDTGMGIAKNIINRIFDPYFTTKETGKGTGLGLAISYGIVEKHGGLITVDSNPGKGSTFHVYLPVMKTRFVQSASKEEAVIRGGTEHILFVDDEREIVDLAMSMLERLGYRVTARTSSLDSLTDFRNDPDRFDLVITDMTMPNMTGIQLAAEIHKIRPEIPIILCTGFSHQIDENDAGRMGISAFVMKPIVRNQLGALIRKVLST